MKNLLWITHAGLGQRGKPGAPTFWKTVEGFLRDGWRIWIVDAGTGLDTPRGVETWEDGLYIQRFPAPLLRVSRVRKLGSALEPLRQRMIMARLGREAEALIRREGLSREDTVVYAHEVTAVRPGKQISLRHGMPLVTRFYGVWDFLNYEDTPCNRLRYYPKFDAYGTPADLVIMTNDGTRGDEVLRRVGNSGDHVRFWRNGVDIPDPNRAAAAEVPGLLPEDRVLITLSRLHPGKRVDRSIRALAEIRRTHPDVKLLVCGYGSEQQRLERVAQEEGVADAVVFTGAIPHDRVFSYLKRADIFLSFYEASNLGNPIFEAMRCGLPVIASDVGATNTVVIHGENGLLLPVEGIEKRIPEAICTLLNDPALARRLSDGARSFAEKNFWTWDERIAAEVLEVGALLEQSGT